MQGTSVHGMRAGAVQEPDQPSMTLLAPAHERRVMSLGCDRTCMQHVGWPHSCSFACIHQHGQKCISACTRPPPSQPARVGQTRCQACLARHGRRVCVAVHVRAQGRVRAGPNAAGLGEVQRAGGAPQHAGKCL